MQGVGEECCSGDEVECRHCDHPRQINTLIINRELYHCVYISATAAFFL